jgi:hypothetical protein
MGGEEPNPLAHDEIVAEPWTGVAGELEAAATGIARDLSQRLFLDAGAGRPYFFDQAGNYTG